MELIKLAETFCFLSKGSLLKFPKEFEDAILTMLQMSSLENRNKNNNLSFLLESVRRGDKPVSTIEAGQILVQNYVVDFPVLHSLLNGVLDKNFSDEEIQVIINKAEKIIEDIIIQMGLRFTSKNINADFQYKEYKIYDPKTFDKFSGFSSYIESIRNQKDVNNFNKQLYMFLYGIQSGYPLKLIIDFVSKKGERENFLENLMDYLGQPLYEKIIAHY